MNEPSIHWFKRNVAEWATNPVIQSLTDFQTGWYVNLEMAAFMAMGYLPDDVDLLWRTARASTKNRFIKYKDLVLTEYERVEVDGKAMLFFPRIGAWYKQAEARSQRAHSAAMVGADKRRSDAKADAA